VFIRMNHFLISFFFFFDKYKNISLRLHYSEITGSVTVNGGKGGLGSMGRYAESQL
jgi:hypothetical protein